MAKEMQKENDIKEKEIEHDTVIYNKMKQNEQEVKRQYFEK